MVDVPGCPFPPSFLFPSKMHVPDLDIGNASPMLKSVFGLRREKGQLKETITRAFLRDNRILHEKGNPDTEFVMSGL